MAIVKLKLRRTTEEGFLVILTAANRGYETEQGYFILNLGLVWYNATRLKVRVSTSMSQTAIIEAFAEVEDRRRKAGQRHTLPLCLALFTLAIAAGNKGFLAIGDWVTSTSRAID